MTKTYNFITPQPKAGIIKGPGRLLIVGAINANNPHAEPQYRRGAPKTDP